ncbi:hypothetical protein FHS61_000852 [Altererythrobacter atlanticus]|uniref:Uncharacterized protein n=1 Tax=Croceibacterium atlanticum TaxID=1267766 RepID=A0A0F7KUY3_9SPHN|nr:hypothetical protein [Croceibacterium atlanticum]AKH43444.1 hypothetical protein WYH_02414 [Croceibacterium atlanticum]MBB5731848.1 hypothetical protein [Croceibacterium atlanticum]
MLPSARNMRLLKACFTAAILIPGAAVFAQDSSVSETTPTMVASYADLVGLAERAPMVALVEVVDQAQVENARAPGLEPGHARLYLEAKTTALLAGRTPIGESVAYLVDVPLDSKEKAPKLKKQRFILFAAPVSGRPGALQLVGPQLPASPDLEARLRGVIAQLAQPDRPPMVEGVRDVISVPGNLAGESETQMFVDTSSGAPVSLSVIRRPGQPPQWGVSWSEIVDQAASAPEPETIEWYRLACSLPRELPEGAFLQNDRESIARAREDYAFILDQLGPCIRIVE